MNILDFATYKLNQKKITMVTCYDYTSARILSNTSIDAVLVGDSAAMTMHGYSDTIPASLDMMCFHTKAVKTGLKGPFLIADMPFLMHRQGKRVAMHAVQRLIQSGAQAVKIEGARGNIELIRHITESGVPVMGHLGLTIQSIHAIGGYKIQGKTEAVAKQLEEDAIALQDAGCFSIVLECVPREVARHITKLLTIPTIGIGAGKETDGQVLVFQDLLGLNLDFKPRFVKTYLDGQSLIKNSIDQYVSDVQSGAFPNDETSY